MNMITALLGATGLLLVVAVVLSVMKMSNASEEAELKELRAELAALNDQQSRLNPPAPAPPLDPGPTASAPITPIPAPISPPSPNPGNGVAVPPAAPTLPSPVSEVPAPGEGVVTRTQLEAELAKAERENELLKEEGQSGPDLEAHDRGGQEAEGPGPQRGSGRPGFKPRWSNGWTSNRTSRRAASRHHRTLTGRSSRAPSSPSADKRESTGSSRSLTSFEPEKTQGLCQPRKRHLP